MRKAFSFMLFCICQVQLYGGTPDSDDFGLDTTFQENFHVLDETSIVPVPLGHDKNGCICKKIPNKLTICFGRVRCDSVPHIFNITTPGMKLTGTHITKLHPGDFEGYYQVQKLQIEGNLMLETISPGVLNSNFSELKNLSISFNPLLKNLHRETFDGLVNLTHLFLVKNGFHVLPDITPAFAPKYLPNLYRLSLCENSFFKIRSGDFLPLTNSTIQVITLVVCRLEIIDPDSFKPLSNLRTLRLGENSFNASTITAVIKKIAEHHIPLKLLNLYSAGFRNNIPMELMKAIAKTNISELNLASNQFESIRSGSFPFMPKILVLDLRDVLALDISPDAFKNLPNLRTLLLSENSLPFIPKGALVPSLRNLDLQKNAGGMQGPSYFSICNECFSNMINLLYLNLNYNNLYQLIRGNFDGMSRLRVLSLKNASIYHIQNFTFKDQKNLVFLNLENNDFIRRSYPSGMWPNIFSGLGNLKVLLLGSCSISYFSLHGNPFVHLKSLVHLGLQYNNLNSISPNDFAPLINLQSIDLSYNCITVWDERFFFHNRILRIVLLQHNKITHISEAMFEDFTNRSIVKLKYNSFTCDCSMFDHYSTWIKKHEDSNILKILDNEAHCLVPSTLANYTLGDFFSDVENNSLICDIEMKARLLVMLPLILLILFFVTLVSLVYFYRWHIKYWMFLSRLYLSRKGKLRPRKKIVGINNYIYDAFISYSTEDRNFVLRLASMLEKYEPYLKLCIYERDFQVGAVLSESILEGVAKSRKTILIISDNYAKSQWCRWESHLAEHHRLFFENEEGEYVDDTLILVKLGPVGNNHLTPMLKYLLKTRIYLQWEIEEKKQRIFWDKLRAALLPPMSENNITESTHI